MAPLLIAKRIYGAMRRPNGGMSTNLNPDVDVGKELETSNWVCQQQGEEGRDAAAAALLLLF